MASSLQFLLFSSLLFLSFSYAQRSSRPNALVLPVSKDSSTLQYLTRINQRTPLVPVTLVVDLGGPFLWVDCENNYVSSTYRSPGCTSDKCSISRFAAVCGGCFPSPRPAGSPCMRNRCILSADNSVTRTASDGELLEDVVSVQSTDGSNPGPAATVSKFLFSCAPTTLLEGLAGGATGMAGLGQSQIALPSQLASSFDFPRKFAVCLSSASGVIFFGDGPYNLLPNIDPAESLTYTPLVINPVSTASGYLFGEPSVEYFIRVTSIRVSDKAIALNSSLLSIDAEGYGGTKISTVNPYTVMESSIFKAFTEAFINEATARNITRVAPVAPFNVCLSRTNVPTTRVGPSVPFIDLVLERESWRMTGSNSIVLVRENVYCLGFVDGGLNPRTAIVIGGYQLENNFLEFDLEASRLGFSSTLLGRQTTCANFNFTSIHVYPVNKREKTTPNQLTSNWFGFYNFDKLKKLYMRVEALEADRESMRQAIVSMRTDKAQLVLLKEISQHLRRDMSPARGMAVKKPSIIGSFSFISIFKWIVSLVFWRKKARRSKYMFGLSGNNVGLLMLLDKEPRMGQWKRLSSTQV